MGEHFQHLTRLREIKEAPEDRAATRSVAQWGVTVLHTYRASVRLQHLVEFLQFSVIIPRSVFSQLFVGILYCVHVEFDASQIKQ